MVYTVTPAILKNCCNNTVLQMLYDSTMLLMRFIDCSLFHSSPPLHGSLHRYACAVGAEFRCSDVPCTRVTLSQRHVCDLDARPYSAAQQVRKEPTVYCALCSRALSCSITCKVPLHLMSIFSSLLFSFFISSLLSHFSHFSLSLLSLLSPFSLPQVPRLGHKPHWSRTDTAN